MQRIGLVQLHNVLEARDTFQEEKAARGFAGAFHPLRDQLGEDHILALTARNYIHIAPTYI